MQSGFNFTLSTPFDFDSTSAQGVLQQIFTKEVSRMETAEQKLRTLSKLDRLALLSSEGIALVAASSFVAGAESAKQAAQNAA